MTARPLEHRCFSHCVSLLDSAERCKMFAAARPAPTDYHNQSTNHSTRQSFCWNVPPTPTQHRVLFKGATLATLEILPGFFRSSLFSTDVRKCFYKEACQGGYELAEYCATGYGGPCEPISKRGTDIFFRGLLYLQQQ